MEMASAIVRYSIGSRILLLGKNHEMSSLIGSECMNKGTT